MSTFAVQWSVTVSHSRTFYHPVNVRAAAEHQIALKKSPGLPLLSGQILGYFRILLSSDENIHTLFSTSYFIFRTWLKPDQHNPAADQENKRNCLTTPKTSVFVWLLSQMIRFTSLYLSECALQVLSLRSPTPRHLIYLFFHPWKRQEPVHEPQSLPCFSCCFYFYDMRE